MNCDLIEVARQETIQVGTRYFTVIVSKSGDFFFFQKDFQGIFHPGSLSHTKEKLPTRLLADVILREGKTARRAKLLSLEAVLFMAAKMRAYDFCAELSSLISPVRFRDFENIVISNDLDL